jgi:subtilisin family serine protease
MSQSSHRRPHLQRLEDRIAPSIGAGDYYWVDGRQIALSERPGQIAVQFSRPVDATAATRPGGVLAGYDLVEAVNSTTAFVRAATSPRPDHSETVAIEERPSVAWSAPVFENPESGGWVVAMNEIIVRLQPGVTAESFFAGDHRLTEYRRIIGTPDTFIAKLAEGSGRAALTLANSLMSDPRLSWASPNLMAQAYLWTNDPLYANQWHLNNTGQSGGTPGADVDAPEAWQITSGSPSIVIADIDDAIQRAHPDLAPNVWPNPGEVPGNSIDDDGNGWTDDVWGWDFWNNDSDPSPPAGSSNSHGTATAGVAVAAGNNNLGVAGIAYSAKLMPIRSNIVPSFVPADVPQAVYYAAGRKASGVGTWRGADILTCSWGFSTPLQALNDSFAWASANGRGGKGLPIFIASGNGGSGSVGYPANLAGSLSGVMAVGGSTHTDVRVSYSQYGPELDFITPTRAGSSQGSGGGIQTTDRTGTAGYSSGDYYANFSGTSSATPLAAGIGALVLSVNPNLTASQLRGLLHNTTDLIGPLSYDAVTGKNLEYGYGRLNAFTAVSGANTREIQVLDGKVNVADNSTSGGYSANIGSNATRTYRVRNQGAQDLILSSLAIASGPFSIVTGFDDSVLSVGEATTFTVRFAPTAGGTFVRDLTFNTNDPDEGSFVIHLSGTAAAAPQIQSIVVNGGAAQRSMVKSLAITFDRIVTLPAQPANAFTFVGPGGNVPFSTVVSTNTGVTLVTLTWPSLTGGSLADGNYLFTVLANQVSAGGVQLDGDGDGLPGGDAVRSLFRFFGDANADRNVDIGDFGLYSGTHGLTSGQTGFLAYFDYNNDGVIDIADFGQISVRMFTTLP